MNTKQFEKGVHVVERVEEVEDGEKRSKESTHAGT